MDSSIFDQLNNIINDKNEFENFKNYMGLDDSFFENTDNDFNEKVNNKNNIFANIDLNQMIMINNIIQKLSNNQNDKSTDLLLSLKPFLSNDKKQKIDVALNFLQIMKIAPLLQNLNMFKEGEKNNEDTK